MVKPLYEKHGWLTGTFDGEGFLIDQARTFADIKITEFVKAAKLKLEQAERFLARHQDRKVKPLREELSAAEEKSQDDQWTIRAKLFEQEMVQQRCISRVEDARNNIAAIGEPKTEDLPLWQQDWLKFQVGLKKGDLRHNEEKYIEEPATSTDELKVRGYIL